MARNAQQVFDAHQQAFETGNLEKLMADYADDAVVVTIDGPVIGKEAIHGFFVSVFKSFPNIQVSFEKTMVEDNTVLLQWSGDSDVATFPHGVATFIVEDGYIQRQTEWFVVVPKQ